MHLECIINVKKYVLEKAQLCISEMNEYLMYSSIIFENHYLKIKIMYSSIIFRNV